MDGSPDGPDHVLFHEWGGDPPPKTPKKEPTMASPNAVVATERIFEKTLIPRGNGRTRKVLRYAAGSVVKPEDVERLGVKADGTQPKIPEPKAETTVAPATKRVAKKAAPRKAAAKKAPAKRAAKKKA